ncbi:MAG: TRAG family protein [Ralstonia sp.]|uniref:type IV secretory system conjugative DNA transfer family protein n=1 Tax=Ralstonia sp. TaxID=54061 RepID=UPI0025795473|nr:type IV secretory system conjugative DNA transfer family protein [Ralstonia sp.]MBA4232458.1 TRAG family protein [Ralstonia sp.]
MNDFETRLANDIVRGLPGKTGGIVDAAWLDPAELLKPDWAYRDASKAVAGLILGYRNDRGVGSIDNRHVLTVAGSRGGKGVSLIVPNLLMYDGSAIAIDPKGELAAITARARRQKGQKVIILDPYDASGLNAPGSFNPLDQLDAKKGSVKDDAGLIADALIIGSEREPHFTDTARILVKTLILYTLTLAPSERSLVTVYRLLAGSHERIMDVAERSEGKVTGRAALFGLLISCTGHFDNAIAGMGANFAQMADREMASVFSTALTQLDFLGSDEMAPVLQSGDFELSELKTGKATLYLCLPATRMSTHSRWLRVIINLALVAFERTKVKVDIPVLMVLDEFPVLGHMKSVETAAGLMAGFGVKLWVVLQDLTQIKRLYRDSWETFIGNAGVSMFWSNSDKTTLDYISDKLGQTGVRLEQSNDTTMQQRLSGASGRREELRVQKLAAPHELEKMLDRRKRRVLILAAGESPVILQRIQYYDDKPFAGLFDAWNG